MEKTPIPAGSLPPLPEYLSNLVASVNALIVKFDAKYTDLQTAIDFMYGELDKVEATYAKKAVQVIAGTNLTGGGDLSANRTINLANASTTVKGAVQLTTATNSTSATLAATGSAVKTAYDRGTTALNTANGKLGKTENAVSASKLATPRAIALAGDLSGSTNFDGSANVTIHAIVRDDSHAHVIGNVDGLQEALNDKLGSTGKAHDSARLEGKTKAQVIAEARQGTALDATALAIADLDTIKAPGFYFQNSNANATSARHYPESQAGSLLVVEGAGVTQIYHVYNSSRVWTRSQYSSSAWTAWAREYNTLNKPSKTDVGLSNVPNFPAVNSVSDTSTSKLAVAASVKTAYDRGTTALNTANGKLGKTENAVSASKLATARAIALGGDLTGSANFDGTGNITITAAVKDDSHAHIISNVDGLQTALNGKLATNANAVSASKLATKRRISLGGDVTGSVLFDGTGDVVIQTDLVGPSGPTVTWNEEVNPAPKKNDIHYEVTNLVLPGPVEMEPYTYQGHQPKNANVHFKGFNYYVSDGKLYRLSETLDVSNLVSTLPASGAVQLHGTKKFLAVFTPSHCHTSEDGINWSGPLPHSAHDISFTAADDDFFYVVSGDRPSDSNTYVYKSVDGRNWIAACTLQSPSGGKSIIRFAAENGCLGILYINHVDTYDDTVISLSKDGGDSWQNISFPMSVPYSTLHMYGRFAFVGAKEWSACIDIYTDSILWKKITPGAQLQPADMYTDGAGNVYLDHKDDGAVYVVPINGEGEAWKKVPLNPPRSSSSAPVVFGHNKMKDTFFIGYSSNQQVHYCRFMANTEPFVDSLTHTGTKWLESTAVLLGQRVSEVEVRTTTERTRKTTISSSPPSGGQHGDIWIQYT